MTVYELSFSDRRICGIDVETPSWLPVRPRIRHGWLRFLVAAALHQYFNAPAAVVIAA
jgi:hypothetical protein